MLNARKWQRAAMMMIMMMMMRMWREEATTTTTTNERLWTENGDDEKMTLFPTMTTRCTIIIDNAIIIICCCRHAPIPGCRQTILPPPALAQPHHGHGIRHRHCRIHQHRSIIINDIIRPSPLLLQLLHVAHWERKMLAVNFLALPPPPLALHHLFQIPCRRRLPAPPPTFSVCLQTSPRRRNLLLLLRPHFPRRFSPLLLHPPPIPHHPHGRHPCRFHHPHH